MAAAKRRLLILLGVLTMGRGFSQAPLSGHELEFDMGSLRNRYLYPNTDVRYRSPELADRPLRLSFRLRSYGTLFVYSRSSYDLTPLAEYSFPESPAGARWSAGIGLDGRVRLSQDSRSDAVSSAEPLLSGAYTGRYRRFAYTAPLWTRFYDNGIAFTVLPEVAYAFTATSLFVRYELSFLQFYGDGTHEWRRDLYLGMRYRFGKG